MNLSDSERVKQFYAGRQVRRVRVRDPVVEAVETRFLETFRSEQAASGQQSTKVVPDAFQTNDEPGWRTPKMGKR